MVKSTDGEKIGTSMLECLFGRKRKDEIKQKKRRGDERDRNGLKKNQKGE